MSFLETPRFPEEVSAWALGGPEYMTAIAQAGGGAEARNIVWTYPLCRWDIGAGLRTIANAQATIAFHRNLFGRGYGFRMKDPVDYSADYTTGVLGTTGIGTGLPTYQLYKNYVVGSSTVNRKITKPVVGAVTIKRGGVVANAGSSAGQYGLDTTTGIVTFVADATANIVTGNLGATTQVTLSGAIAGLAVSDKLYLSGLGGADASFLNNQAWPITNIAGAVYTLAVNTTGKTITASGTGAMYPQPREALVWSGQFDVPVRFDNDWLQLSLDPGGLLNYTSVLVRELRL
jgi:uncharacterized protein (TIGR02217 family)